jgi:hypothetical protein
MKDNKTSTDIISEEWISEMREFAEKKKADGFQVMPIQTEALLNLLAAFDAVKQDAGDTEGTTAHVEAFMKRALAAEAERDRMREAFAFSARSVMRETIRDMTRDNESLRERALDAEEELNRAKSDLEIAVEALKKLRRRGDSLETFDSDVHDIVKRALAFIAQN